MNKLINPLSILLLVATILFGCEKDVEKTTIIPPSGVKGFSTSASAVVLTSATDLSNVVTFKFQAPDYGSKVIATYTLQFDLPADTTGAAAWGKAISVKLDAGVFEKTYLGKDFNSLLVNQLGLPTGTVSTLAVRIKSDVNQSTGTASVIPSIFSTLKMTVTPYKAVVIYPALVVKGGNSWVTPNPTLRTDGFVLTSTGFDTKYEGYLNLPNADGYGGDAFQLVSSVDQKVYGWGGTSTTIALNGGNLYITPAPAYQKVNVDLTAGTIKYVPVKFYVSGDDNGWSTSATPMTYDATTKKLTATNVALTAGKVIVFTANGGYDISYKVDADGKLIFAGPPNWTGNNIPVTKTGVYTVTLDLSQGAGNYTYSIK